MQGLRAIPSPQGLRAPLPPRPSAPTLPPPRKTRTQKFCQKKISRSAGSIERALGKDARSRWPCSRRLSSRFLDVERRPFSGARCREGAPHFLPFASTSLQLLFPAISKLCPFFCHGVSGWHERVEPQKTTSDVFFGESITTICNFWLSLFSDDMVVAVYDTYNLVPWHIAGQMLMQYTYP